MRIEHRHIVIAAAVGANGGAPGTRPFDGDAVMQIQPAADQVSAGGQIRDVAGLHTD